MSEVELIVKALDELSGRHSRSGIYGYIVSEDGHQIVASMRAGGHQDVLVIIWNGKAHAQLKGPIEIPIGEHFGRF